MQQPLNTSFPARWYPSGRLAKYPHFFGKDLRLIDLFARQYGSRFENAAYDVAVGGASAPPPGTPKALAQDWRYLASYKCDAIFLSADFALIVEVKSTNSSKAYGQLLLYELILAGKNDALDNVEMCIVCNQSNRYLNQLAEKLNITVLQAYPTAEERIKKDLDPFQIVAASQRAHMLFYSGIRI